MPRSRREVRGLYGTWKPEPLYRPADIKAIGPALAEQWGKVSYVGQRQIASGKCIAPTSCQMCLRLSCLATKRGPTLTWLKQHWISLVGAFTTVAQHRTIINIGLIWWQDVGPPSTMVAHHHNKLDQRIVFVGDVLCMLKMQYHWTRSINTQQTQNICITFIQCRPKVFDVGPTLYKCYTNVLCVTG